LKDCPLTSTEFGVDFFTGLAVRDGVTVEELDVDPTLGPGLALSLVCLVVLVVAGFTFLSLCSESDVEPEG
jgi:hypothetical protein